MLRMGANTGEAMTIDLRGWTIAFDLDGTLIHTAPDLFTTAQTLLAERGLPTVPEHILHPQISYGSRRMMETAFAHLGHEIDEAEMDEVFHRFLAHYRSHIAVHSRPFPYLPETLAQLRDAGAKIAVCTNKLEGPTRELLEQLNMTDSFDAIAGRDTYPVHKPDPGHLLSVIDDAGGDAQRAIMVGDSETDVATAKAAEVPVVGVTFGYTAIPVTELECDAVIDSYAQFFDAISGIRNVRLARQPL